MSLLATMVTLRKAKDIEALPLFVCRKLQDSENRNLRLSISKWGVINPIHLYPTASGLCVLDGLRRLKLAQEMDIPDVPVRVLPENWLRADAFKLYITLNDVFNFSIVEKMRLLNAALAHECDAKGLDDLRQQLDIPASLMTEGLKVLRLPPDLQDAIGGQNWPLRVLLKFLDFSVEDQKQLAGMIFDWPINANKWADILETLQDLRRREKKSAAQILTEVVEQLPLHLPPEQKEKALRDSLRTRRNPRYQEKMDAFLKATKPLSAHPNTQVVPTPFFEDDAVELRAKLKKRDDLQDLIQLLQNPAWDKIW